MAVISELIRTEENGKLSFGDYTLAAKAKLDNFEKDGDIYKVKTNLGGKLSLSVELEGVDSVDIKVSRK